MRKSDIILIGVILVVAAASFLIFQFLAKGAVAPDGTAIVYYNNSKILEIELIDGSYKIYDDERVISIDEDEYIYHVEGSNPYGVKIEYLDNRVRVIDEESPKNICQAQGWSNSPLSPITCLPNNIIIIIKAKVEDTNLPDDVTG